VLWVHWLDAGHVCRTLTATGRGRPLAREDDAFLVEHRRALIGHDIAVRVTAAAKETIARVATELDGRTLARDALAPPEVQYERMFHQVGGADRQDHVLAVHATSADGTTTVASLRWNDVS